MSITNIDPETGIHYGVISQSSIDPEALDEMFDDSRDLAYEQAVEQMKDELAAASKDQYIPRVSLTGRRRAFEDIVEEIGIRQPWREQMVQELLDCEPGDRDALFDIVDQEFCDNFLHEICESFLYEQKGYKLTHCLHFDIFILQSPYYTYAPSCSPCVPNVGNLNSRRKLKDIEDPNYLERQCGALGIFKTYCLGPEWFDQESPCPYPAWRIADNYLI